MIRVGWFTPLQTRDFNRVYASIWIRCLQLLPYLDELGVVSTVNEVDAPMDIAIFVRWQTDEAQALAQKLRERGIMIIYDLAVNYYDVTQGVSYLSQRVTPALRDECLRMTNLAEAITCCSAYITERAAEHHPQAVYLSDSIDRRHFSKTKFALAFWRPRLRVLWNGTKVKLKELTPLLPLLEQYNLRLTAITNPDPPPLESFAYRAKEWQYERFPRQLLAGEIGVSYRKVDNPYNKGHSLFKIGVMMAQGVPVVASPVPSYYEVLGEAGAGRICTTLDEWAETLALLTDNRRTLLAWSREAISRIEPYTTERMAHGYHELFKQLMGL